MAEQLLTDGNINENQLKRVPLSKKILELLCYKIQAYIYAYLLVTVIIYFTHSGMQDRCLYCGTSENSFIHPEYNCKWVRIFTTVYILYRLIDFCNRYNVINAKDGVALNALPLPLQKNCCKIIIALNVKATQNLYIS